MFAHFFINRPVFACVISLFILLVGIVAMSSLPVAQFPDIVPPTVSITANYPGVSAEDVVNAVCIPIEMQVNGVDDMLYMSSTCTSDGTCTITVTFAVGTNPDMATVNVQNRVKAAEPQLPDDVRRQGVNVRKQSTNIVLFLSIVDAETMLKNGDRLLKESTIEGNYFTRMLEKVGITIFSPKKHKKESHQDEELIAGVQDEETDGGYKEKRGPIYLANYTNLYVKDTLSRVPGVGSVMIFNTKDFSMRIWLDPKIMAARGLSVQDVINVLREQNVQVASGRIGDAPVPPGQVFNTPIITLGRLADVSEFEEIVVRRGKNGELLKLKDVALIELGSVSYSAEAQADGVDSCALGVMQRPG
ncbi:MAG: efflux RND transporter permease subunit, partial [Thermoguttaceae bacterium]